MPDTPDGQNSSGKPWSLAETLKSMTVKGMVNRMVRAIAQADPNTPLRKVLAAVLARGGEGAALLVRILERAEDTGMSRQAIIELVKQAGSGHSVGDLRGNERGTPGSDKLGNRVTRPSDVREMLEQAVKEAQRATPTPAGDRPEPQPTPPPATGWPTYHGDEPPPKPAAAASQPDPPAKPTGLGLTDTGSGARPTEPAPAKPSAPVPGWRKGTEAWADPAPPAKPTGLGLTDTGSGARPTEPAPAKPSAPVPGWRKGTEAWADPAPPAKPTGLGLTDTGSGTRPTAPKPASAASRPTTPPPVASGYGAFGRAPVSAATRQADFEKGLDRKFEEAGYGKPVEQQPDPEPPRKTVRGEFERGFAMPFKPIAQFGRYFRRAAVSRLPRGVRNAISPFMRRWDKQDARGEAGDTGSAPSGGQAGRRGVPPGSSRPVAPAGGMGGKGGGSTPKRPGGDRRKPTLADMRAQVVAVLASLPIIGGMFQKLQQGGGVTAKAAQSSEGGGVGTKLAQAAGIRVGTKLAQAAGIRIALQGVALAAGVATGVLTGLGLAIVGLGFASRSAAKSIVADREKYRNVSGPYAAAYASRDINDRLNLIKSARDTARTGAPIINQETRVNKAWQPFNASMENVSNKLTYLVRRPFADLEIAIASAAGSLAKLTADAIPGATVGENGNTISWSDQLQLAIAKISGNDDMVNLLLKRIADNTEREKAGRDVLVPGLEMIRRSLTPPPGQVMFPEHNAAPLWED